MRFPTTFFGLSLFALCTAYNPSQGLAQCPTWQELPEQEMKAIQDSYVVFRDAIKKEDYEIAFMHWQIVYKGAAAADGQRPTVYSDGRKLQLRKFMTASTKKAKTKIAQMVFTLREQQKECYPASELEEIPAELLKYKDN
ncbi:MAG: hypothetical protein KTR30_20825 [Saprospiraceae bacterium]|nr:hypothetical protein [Saprospiraceae bacterium]